MALQLNTEPSWKHFLLASGIPDNESAEYSKIFVENRINEVVILDITADHLKAMDITVVGDILSILRHAKTLLPPQTPVPDSTTPSSQVYRPPRAMVKLPNIVSEMTHPQFRKFGIDWDVYKKITNFRYPKSDHTFIALVMEMCKPVSSIHALHFLNWMKPLCYKQLN